MFSTVQCSFLFSLFLSLSSPILSSMPRNARISGKQFIETSTNATIVLRGPNIVVKGPPYLPSVDGEDACPQDVVDANCTANGNCTTCTTFTEGDVKHLKSRGWNVIRLGVVWAGAQPEDSDSLDPDFVKRLDAILSLCDREGIHVVLDNHGDMVGSAGCGNGVPMWFQQKAGPQYIGKPLETGFPYDIVPDLQIKKLQGYSYCGDNTTMWELHAGDPNYNLLNPCCQQMNSDNPGQLGYTKISQATMDYLVEEGPGRDAFVRYWRLMAEAVVNHPSAFAAELMNEPMSIRRRDMFDTWRACAEAINAVIPDMSVSITDTGEGAVIPAWVTKFFHGGEVLDKSTEEWIIKSTTLFYSWHWYGAPTTAKAVANVQAVANAWNVPTFLTEFGSCDAWIAAENANISYMYWHYSCYCNTGPSFGNRSVPQNTFGACLLGWAGGDVNKTCNSFERQL
eukprot:m.40313 g.40313  ORF g.40313 m.40313 type:complete len:453 (+) comp9652_c0_seq1:178-1536(+)